MKLKNLKINKFAEIELDQLGKLIIGIVILIILIVIVSVVINGELSSQGDKIKNIFTFY